MTSACHACVLRGGPHQAHPRDPWRLVCADCAGAPVLVPAARVRLCSERIGTWGQSRDVWQSWDTGFGAVFLARKHYLSPTPDGNVAIVFQSDADAVLLDKLLGALAVKPNRPLPLRYCHNSRGLCTGICFASSADTSCMTHRTEPKKPKEKAKEDADSRPTKRARLSTDSLMHFDFSACDTPAKEGGESDDDSLSFESAPCPASRPPRNTRLPFPSPPPPPLSSCVFLCLFRSRVYPSRPRPPTPIARATQACVSSVTMTTRTPPPTLSPGRCSGVRRLLDRTTPTRRA